MMISNIVNFSIAMLVSASVIHKRRHPHSATNITDDPSDILRVVYQDTAPGTIQVTIADAQGDFIFNQIITLDSLRNSLDSESSGVFRDQFEVTHVHGLHRADPVNYEVYCLVKEVSAAIRIVRIQRVGSQEATVLSVVKVMNNNFLINIYDATKNLRLLDTIMV